jgi:hypothetical protein
MPSSRDSDLDLIRRALSGLRYGEVVIAVHDGEVVQIARTEKVRPARAQPRREGDGDP